MTTANALINTLMGQDKDAANEVFSALIQDKLTDALEVAKVEIASTIMGNEEVVNEGAGMDAQRRWVRQVGAIGKEYHDTDRGHKVSIPRHELKSAARKYFQKYQPHGAAFVDRGAGFVRDARRAVKTKRLQGEEVEAEPINELKPATLASYIRKKHQNAGKSDWYPSIKRGPVAAAGQRLAAFRLGSGGVGHDMMSNKKRKDLNWTASDLAHTYAGGESNSYNAKAGKKREKIVVNFRHGEIGNVPTKRKAILQKYREKGWDLAGAADKAELAHKAKLKKLKAKYVGEAIEGGAVTNAQLNRNVLANIRRASQALKLTGITPAIAAAGHRDFGKLAAKNPKTPGYMLMRKLAPNKAQAVQALTQAGVPLGQSLEANPNDFNQVLQRIKRFK